jgi:hypothetical protein
MLGSFAHWARLEDRQRCRAVRRALRIVPTAVMAATVVDAADNDDLRVHVNELLTQWQDSVADVYVRFGDSPSIAQQQSTVLLAAIEGALILARARRSTEPLDTVERHFATVRSNRASNGT